MDEQIHHKISGSITRLKKQRGVVGKEGCCEEGGCEASKEVALEQRPAGREGRRQDG